VSDRPIADDEVLYRRVPSKPPWFQPPDRISSYTFKLRKGDLGLSVYRKQEVSAEAVLSDPRSLPGSFLVQATAGEVRSLGNAKGDPLNLRVIAVGDENDPGHAEIRGPQLGKLSQSAADALKKLFQRL